MVCRGVWTVTAAAWLAAGCATTDTGSREWDLVERGFYNMVEQDWGGAEQDFLAALEENPNNPYAVLNLGAVYQNTGREAQAKALYERLFALKPEATADKATYDADVGHPLTDIAQRNLSLMQP